MKVNLMFRNKDFVVKSESDSIIDTLANDLGFKYIISNMSQGDKIISNACTTALFNPLQSIDEICYRQENLIDALRKPDVIRQLYDITIETEKKRKNSFYWLSSSYISSVYSNAIGLLKIYIEMLMKLRRIADKEVAGFQSEGFLNFFTMLQRELNDDYFAEVNSHLNELSESNGMLISSKLGNYLQGVGYVLRCKNQKGFWRKWTFAPSYTIAPRDDIGAADLGKRRDRAINEVSNALAQAAEHLESFFAKLRNELAFYVGCINLAKSLKMIKMPICIPKLIPIEQRKRSYRNLYDVGLALTKNDAIVGNDIDTTDKLLYIITGANQGGKSTFLRSIGQAQLMAQCGMFVGAEEFLAPIRNGVFTHFKKEEDSSMKSGKLDEELSRMSKIVDVISWGSLVLFNESFSSTNEYEGSEIFRQITKALIDNNVEVFSVTHFYTYATDFLNEKNTEFLRAERLENGERTFRIVKGEPIKTAFGEDLYRKIFADSL
ncbi:MutS-related protein [Thermobrachium celere]|uniref:MutS domain protein, family 4 n=1 Tax=Thermobrachium celere DSM 8682 TaxID=941824 RepID=R7RTB0_9CLOT|nr:MutS domain protein, family 4 [Thermobrachium celere]CDF58626.1 MutS domain protein, family 4 [Thermobrachium celere DSM 8682]